MRVFFSVIYLLALDYYNHVSLKFIIIIIIIIITLTYHCLAVPLQRNVTTVAWIINSFVMPVSFNLFVTAFHDLFLFFSIMYLLVLGYYNHVSLKFVIIIIIIIIIITLTHQSITVVFQRHLIADVQLFRFRGLCYIS